MSARISKISLILFVLLLVLSASLLSVAGDYWPWYAVTSVFAVVPLVVGPRCYRLVARIALFLFGVPIVRDSTAGRNLDSEHPVNRRWRRKITGLRRKLGSN